MMGNHNKDNLLFFRLWHDNTGKDPSWFFSRMMVHDIQTNNKYFFICDRWMAVEYDDGMVRFISLPYIDFGGVGGGVGGGGEFNPCSAN